MEIAIDLEGRESGATVVAGFSGLPGEQSKSM